MTFIENLGPLLVAAENYAEAVKHQNDATRLTVKHQNDLARLRLAEMALLNAAVQFAKGGK